jgi:hypothetical protein
MSNAKHVNALKSTSEALIKIRKELKPFVKLLDSDDAEQRAQAQAVVALSLGTVRYIGARIRGKDEGRKQDDPLRQDLNQIRNVLVQIERKRKSRGENESHMEPSCKKESKQTGLTTTVTDEKVIQSASNKKIKVKKS